MTTPEQNNHLSGARHSGQNLVSRMKSFIQSVKIKLARMTDHQHIQEMNGAQKTTARFFHMISLSIRKFSRDFCFERAASLSYVTILSLIPLLVLFLSIANVLGVDREINAYIQNTILPFAAPEFQTELSEIITDYITPTIFTGAKWGLINFAAIVGLIMGSMGILITAERVFNTIWNVRETRGLVQKITAFWVVLTTSPFLILLSIWIADFLSPANGVIDQIGQKIFIVKLFYDQFIPFSVSFIAYTLFFVFLPSTRVKFKSAAVGGIISALLWEISKRGFYFYVSQVGTVTNFYKQIATIPLFFFWVFMTWIIILLGAEISYVYQHYKILRKEDEEDHDDPPAHSPTFLAVSMLMHINIAFRQGLEIPNLEVMAERMQVRVELLINVANDLVDLNVLIADANQPLRFLLVKDASKIFLQDVVSKIKEMEFPAEADGVLAAADDSSRKDLSNIDDWVKFYFSRARRAFFEKFNGKTLDDVCEAVDLNLQNRG